MFGLFQQGLLLVGLLILATVLTSRAARRDPNPSGLGGWLVVMGFTLVLTPPGLLWNCLHDLIDNLPALRSHTISERALLLLIAFELVLVGWSIYVVVLFFRTRRRFRWAWIILVSSVVVPSAVGWALGAGSTTEFTKKLVLSAAWAGYLFRSKRVANTFIH